MFLELFYSFFSGGRYVPSSLLVLIINKIRVTFLFANDGITFINAVFFAMLKKSKSSYLCQYSFAAQSHQFKTSISVASWI